MRLAVAVVVRIPPTSRRGSRRAIGWQGLVVRVPTIKQHLHDVARRILKALDFVNLRQKVNRRYRRNMRGRYMLNDDSFTDLLTQLDGDQRPLWLPSTREGAPNRIYGDPYTVNDDMPNNEDTKKPVAYGDFSAFKVRTATGPGFGPSVRRFSGDTYGPKGQVAFMISVRYAGRLVNSEAVKTLDGAS